MYNRKDSKGRCLHRGEVERKGGLYQFSYIDTDHVRRFIYARTLKELREKETGIIKDLTDGINTSASHNMTLDQLFELFMETKNYLSLSTNVNYRYLYYHFISEPLGKKK